MVTVQDRNGRERKVWQGGEKIEAVAYDVPIPGFSTTNTINIRLWGSKPKKVNSNLSWAFRSLT